MKQFLQEIMKKKYLEHQTFGRQVICPREPANQSIILKIVGFLSCTSQNMIKTYMFDLGTTFQT